MNIEPDDIANLCVIFRLLNKGSIEEGKLIQMVSETLRIDSRSSPGKIIDEAINSGVIRSKDSKCIITDLGKKIGSAQKDIRPTLSDKAKHAFLRDIYLNTSARNNCCGSFLMQWKPDATISTFIYRRNYSDDLNALGWLKKLERVGLITVNEERALIEKKYLDLVNNLLAEMRNIATPKIGASGAIRQKIGDIGEKLAIQYEKKRLIENGQEVLLPLVKHISLIDGSVGYDVVSCQGIGKNPDAPIYIEVKSTTEPIVQFIWSYNEQNVARNLGGRYWIYCFTLVDLENESAQGPFKIKNPIKKISSPDYLIEARDILVKRAGGG